MMNKLAIGLIGLLGLAACDTLQAAGVSSSTLYKMEIANHTKSSICAIDAVSTGGPATGGKPLIETTALPEPIKAGETKPASVRLHVGTATLLHFKDCQKSKVAEASVNDGPEPIKVTAQ
jgi:hypothetical protein